MEAPGRGPERAGPRLTGAKRAEKAGPSSRPSPIARSFVYAWSGLAYLYETQRNMRIHLLSGALAGATCIVLGVGRVEVLMVVLAIAGVLLAEVVNTVAEALTDLMEPHLNPIAKVIKDVAAAGVLLGAAFSVLIGILVFYPAIPTLTERLRAFFNTRLVAFGVYLVVAVIPALAGLALPVRGPVKEKRNT